MGFGGFGVTLVEKEIDGEGDGGGTARDGPVRLILTVLEVVMRRTSEADVVAAPHVQRVDDDLVRVRVRVSVRVRVGVRVRVRVRVRQQG